MTQDTRKSRRVPVKINVVITSDSGLRVEGEILNLSMGGAFISTQSAISVGQTILIHADSVIPDIKLQATVAEDPTPWVADIPPAIHPGMVKWKTQEPNPGFGVQFQELDENQERAVRMTLEYYDRLRLAGVKF